MEDSTATINYLWKLENYCFCDFYCNRQLNSPVFTVNTPVPCKWSLYMFPNGHGVDKYVGIYLKRSKKDRGPKEIKVRFKISLIDVDGSLCPETSSIENTFCKGCEWGHNEFIKRSELVTGSTFLYQDTLTVLCQITVIGQNIPESIPRRRLSLQPGMDKEIKDVYKAMNLLYEDDLQTDMLLECRNKTYRVHRCILRARLPKLLKKCESELEKLISDDFLTEKFLLYAYSGKLDIKNINALNIRNTLADYGLLHLEKDLMSQSNACHALTYFPVQSIFHSWKVLTSLLNGEEGIVSSFISNGYQKTSFLIYLNKTDSGDWSINIKTLTSNNDEIFVRCSVSVGDPCLAVRSAPQLCEHVYRPDDWWQSPVALRAADDCLIFNNERYQFGSGFFYLDFIFTYPSGNVQSSLQLVSSNSTSLTDWKIDDREKLLMDLEELYYHQYESDITIVAGRREFKVHKCILCARSPYFRAMFTHDMAEKENNRAELKNDELDERTFAEVVDKLLLFTYCGKFEARSPTFASFLLDAIQMYMIGEEYEDT